MQVADFPVSASAKTPCQKYPFPFPFPVSVYINGKTGNWGVPPVPETGRSGRTGMESYPQSYPQATDITAELSTGTATQTDGQQQQQKRSSSSMTSASPETPQNPSTVPESQTFALSRPPFKPVVAPPVYPRPTGVCPSCGKPAESCPVWSLRFRRMQP